MRAWLFAVALGICLLPLGNEFRFWLVTYFVVTNAYSFYLKRQLLIDVITLSSLYTIRIMAGGAVTGIAISEWLLAFSMFFFASLAFVKRFTELKETLNKDNQKLRGKAYRLEDLEIVRIVGPVSGYISALVVALYLNSSMVVSLYKRPQILWLVCPLIAYWITRVWFLANRGSLNHDPVLFALTDRASWMCGVLSFAVVAAAAA